MISRILKDFCACCCNESTEDEKKIEEQMQNGIQKDILEAVTPTTEI